MAFPLLSHGGTDHRTRMVLAKVFETLGCDQPWVDGLSPSGKSGDLKS